MPTFNLEPTEENIEYVVKMMDIFHDFELGFLTEEELEAELKKIGDKNE